MAGKLTNYGAGVGLDAADGRATQTAKTIYMALVSVAPTAASTPATITEVTWTGYARQAIAMGAPSGSPMTAANTTALTFGPFTAGVGSTAVGYVLVDSSSGTTGNAVAYDAAPTGGSRTPVVGDSITVAIGAVTVQIN
jgi:hypothetical protein